MTSRQTPIKTYMRAFTALFSPSTYAAFGATDRGRIGFANRWAKRAEAVAPGDLLFCYATRVSRWVGVLEALSAMFVDETPLFAPHLDPFVCRIDVRAVVWLPLHLSVPMQSEAVWTRLSFTKHLNKSEGGWTGLVRSPLMTLKPNDCAALLSALGEQAQSLSPYPLTDREQTAVELSYSGGFASRRCTPGSRAYWMNLRRERLETIGRIIDLGASLGRDVWLTRPLRTEGPKWAKNATAALASPELLDEAMGGLDVAWLRGRVATHGFRVPEIQDFDLPVSPINAAPDDKQFVVLPHFAASQSTTSSAARKPVLLTYREIREIS